MSNEIFAIIDFYLQIGIDEIIILGREKKLPELIVNSNRNLNLCNFIDSLLIDEVIVTESLEEKIAKINEDMFSINNLEDLKLYINEFSYCSIKNMANNTVISRGNPNAKIMMIGEAPGAEEDLQAIPFCGESGRMLNDMLQLIDLNYEEDVYISNMVFWRPPLNRKPNIEEITLCLPIVLKHIALIEPKMIIFIGSIAAKILLNKPKALMSELRLNKQKFSNIYAENAEIDAFTLLHPAYLMRQPSNKKLAWFDLLNIKNNLNKK